MISSETFSEVRTLGYSIQQSVFDIDLVKDWRARLAQLVLQQRENATELSQIDDYMVHNPFVLDRTFFAVLEHPTVIQVLNEFLSDTSILYAFTSSSMPAGGTNFSNRIHVDSPRIIPGYFSQIGVIIPLDDFTEENGATYVLPYSFERESVSEDEFFNGAKRLLAKRGDIIILNPRTWHLGGENRTSSDRHALTLSACRSYMRQRFDYPRLLDSQTAADLSPMLRRILGFNVRVPTSMSEYYLPHEERLYKAGQG
jgi:ectoine hydroxylase-related dioxygenase (phytanoyl-CoA dioxygenase family)